MLVVSAVHTPLQIIDEKQEQIPCISLIGYLHEILFPSKIYDSTKTMRLIILKLTLCDNNLAVFAFIKLEYLPAYTIDLLQNIELPLLDHLIISITLILALVDEGTMVTYLPDIT